MKRCLLLLVLLCSACSACGADAPAAPTPVPVAQVAGNWTGTMNYTTTAGGPFIITWQMNLTQAGSAVNGTYVAQNFQGTVAGTTSISNTFSGTLTYNATATNGAACQGTFAVSGTAGGTTLTWTSPGVISNCTNTPLSMTIAVQSR